MSKKTFLYARVSTDQQATGLEAQSRALTDYCRLNKIENYELFADEGISGTKSLRPALDRMMAMVNNDETDCVVVYSFSRYARSTTHLLSGLEIMKVHGCNFCSLTEKIDTNSPIGKAVFVVTSAIAALERDSDLIRKLLKAGMSYRNISKVAACSHGSVSAERLSMKKEEAARLAKIEADKLAQEQFMTENAEGSVVFPEAA